MYSYNLKNIIGLSFEIIKEMNEKQPIKKHEGAATTGEHPRIDKIVQIQNFYTKVTNEFKVRAEYITASR